MAATPSFETDLKQLEKIVRALETGDLGLDAALSQYEGGIRLLASCHAKLEAAGKKVAILTGVSDEGKPQTDKFDAAATFVASKKPGRIVPNADDDDEELPF